MDINGIKFQQKALEKAKLGVININIDLISTDRS